MKVLLVESPAISFQRQLEALREAGIQAESAADAQSALWLLAGGAYRVVVLPLTGGDLQWEIVSAALWARPPARVIALTDGPVGPSLRREAYGAGVWELAEMPRRAAPGGREPSASLVSAVRRALGGAARPVVLFVDDCSEITDGVGSLITEEGYAVQPAASSEEAVRMMSTGDYALIITETRRTGPDGLEVIREAARLQPGVPVVVFTATLDDATFLKSVELGASACVWKLSDPEEIMREILTAMGRGRAQGSSRT